jgi:hypothetical protein
MQGKERGSQNVFEIGQKKRNVEGGIVALAFAHSFLQGERLAAKIQSPEI